MGDEMKEIRDAALAYYHNLSKEQQDAVRDFFQGMDTNGDGRISKGEFQNICKSDESFYVNVNQTFHALDKNGDGSLDFEESITFYYCLVAQRIVVCDGCKASFLKGLYFTCVECFNHNQTGTTFDLCISCYRSRNYVHHHCYFLDNYALLRTKAAYSNSGSTNQPASSAKSVDGSESEIYQVPRSISKREAVLVGVKAVNAAFQIATAVDAVGIVAEVAASCIIM